MTKAKSGNYVRHMSIHALWCHPRSVSTAFERIMRARGDIEVLHEPFMYHHYLTQTERLFPDFTPEPGHPQTYSDIRQMIIDRSASSPIFFKDMAYYVLADLPADPDFAVRMSHAFLVRDPAESIVSYHGRDPDFTLAELGLEAQYKLYQALVDQGQDPLVMTADQLRNMPEATLGRYWRHVGLARAPDAFRWGNRVPDGWQSVVAWHKDVLEHGAIKKPDSTRNYDAEVVDLGAPFTTYERHHRPYYEKMRELAEQGGHQK
ncbi:MAG: hypothetical protein ACR2O1_07015 [Boseongicola sp.]